MTEKLKLLPGKEDKQRPCFTLATMTRQLFNVIERSFLGGKTIQKPLAYGQIEFSVTGSPAISQLSSHMSFAVKQAKCCFCQTNSLIHALHRSNGFMLSTMNWRQPLSPTACLGCVLLMVRTLADVRSVHCVMDGLR